MSEVVSLKRNGSSRVKATCLIENTSIDKPINFLRIIYPNTFRQPIQLRIIKFLKKRLQLVKRFFPRSYIDRYSNYISRFSNRSRHIKSDLAAFKPEELRADPSQTPSHDWQDPLSFKIPCQVNPADCVTYHGFIDKTFHDRIIPESLPSDLGTLISSINHTLLKYEFAHPIQPGESRWISIQFRPKKTSQYIDYEAPLFINKITNSLYYLYNTFGPYNVKAGLLSALDAAKKGNSDQDISYQQAALDEYCKIFGLAEGAKETPYSRICIYIQPHGLDLAFDKSEGIEPIGTHPLVVPLPNSKRRCLVAYPWESGQEGNDPSNFRIAYRGRPINLPHFLFGLSISVTVLIINIFLPIALYLGGLFIPIAIYNYAPIKYLQKPVNFLKEYYRTPEIYPSVDGVWNNKDKCIILHIKQYRDEIYSIFSEPYIGHVLRGKYAGNNTFNCVIERIEKNGAWIPVNRLRLAINHDLSEITLYSNSNDESSNSLINDKEPLSWKRQ